jgi:hypothetical protein
VLGALDNSLLGGLNKHGVLAGWTGPEGATQAVIFAPRRK